MTIQLLTELTQNTAHVQATAHAATQAAAILPMAGDDLIGFTGEKINAIGVLLRGGAAVLGVLFVILTAIKTRGAMAAIVVSGLSAGVFVWIVFNVTDLKDRVDNEVNSAPVPTSTSGHHASTHPTGHAPEPATEPASAAPTSSTA